MNVTQVSGVTRTNKTLTRGSQKKEKPLKDKDKDTDKTRVKASQGLL